MTFTAEEALNRAADTFEITSGEVGYATWRSKDIVFLLRTMAATVNKVADGDGAGARSDSADLIAEYLNIPVDHARYGLVDGAERPEDY